MNDNLKANVSCFAKFHTENKSLNHYSIEHPCPNETFSVLFLLYDLTHLFKNIYNNWITEKMQKLRYIDPDSKETKIASFAHIKEIYENEKNLTVKATNIDFTTIYPTNFDKQKVRLCMAVFQLDHLWSN